MWRSAEAVPAAIGVTATSRWTAPSAPEEALPELPDDGRPHQLRRITTTTGVGAILLGIGSIASVGRSIAGTAVSLAGLAVLMAVALVWRRLAPSISSDLDELSRRRWADDSAVRANLEQRRRVQGVLSASDTLEVVFQPMIDLVTGECVGHEALARFASGGPPDEWFNEARAIGLGVELEMAAIARATQRYRGSGYLSINLSPETLVSAAFIDYITHWEDASRIVVELTEHAIVEDYAQIADALSRVRELGARVAVDDAGSGASSLRHILDLKPDIIKLDRSLIADLDTDRPRRALAASLVRFAVDIGADLVAEGIEREEERGACIELGITLGQGYLLGRPRPL